MEISPANVKFQGALAREMGANPVVKDLLWQVLEHMGENLISDDLPQENLSAQEVVLEVWMDEICYTLTRSYTQPSEIHINLSPREQEIARLVAKGLPNKTIAAVLDISPWTVSTHLRRIFTKLGVSSRAEMVAYVLKEGLLKRKR
jgi:DNA-binding NarL/FixJ family response regulator